MPPTPDPRRLVIRGLARLERTPGAVAQGVLRALLDGPDARDLDPRDRGLITECFYGVLRWRLQLDALIARYARRGVPDDPELANLLRLGVYQLRHLDRVPERAAVFTTVSLARKLRGDKVGAFVNGVLRSLARDRPKLETLAERYAHPQWLVDRLLTELGDEAAVEARLAANMATPPTTLRLKPGVEPPPGAAPTATPSVVQVAGDPAEVRAGIKDGRWLPQDEASVRVVRLLAPEPGDSVLELCAGRGVKSTQIAEAIGPSGRLVSLDASQGKLADAARLLARWAPDVPTLIVAADASRSLPLRAGTRFDRILLDAPCGGLGVIRRRPETVWRRRPEDIPELAKLQRRLLSEAERWLRPGGVLVYAVCTTTPEETTDVIRHRTVDASFSTAPERDGTDGFFVVRLRPVS